MNMTRKYGFGLLIAVVMTSSGCGGGGGGGGSKTVTPTTPTTGTNAAEMQLGADNLPPDSGVAAAASLANEDFSPEDARNTNTLESAARAPQ